MLYVCLVLVFVFYLLQFDARIDDSLKQEFVEEVMVMSKLSHPNIVRFLGANMLPPHLFFAMELCESSLYNELHVVRRMYEIREMLSMMEGVARAMQYLHERSPPIIHRDVKSLNLLIAAGGTLKLCDFGKYNMRYRLSRRHQKRAISLVSSPLHRI